MYTYNSEFSRNQQNKGSINIGKIIKLILGSFNKSLDKGRKINYFV